MHSHVPGNQIVYGEDESFYDWLKKKNFEIFFLIEIFIITVCFLIIINTIFHFSVNDKNVFVVQVILDN